MTVDDTITVKGSPVRAMQKFCEAELDVSQRNTLYDTVPELGGRMRGPILPTETIPVTALNRLTVEAARIKGEPLEQFARRAGHEAAAEAVRGIYRFFALVLTPPALLGKASQMWSAIYSCGRMQVLEQSERSATIALFDFPSEVAGCSRVTGWIERMAGMTGARNVQIEQTQCYATGGPHCEWHLTWER
ncbi:MAG TPA: hypothetical protein VKH35_13320 [Thermoanaerobaculia bacterium]|nr:hypothetical protein [Thermoanaerobaculia bacterium]